MCPVPTFQPLSRYDRTLEHLKCKKETLRWQSNQKCSIPVYHPQYLVSILVSGMFGSKMSLDCHRFFCTRKPLSPTMTTAMWSLGLKAQRSFCSVKDKDASTWQVLILWATMQPQTPTNENIKIYTIYLTIYIYYMNIYVSQHSHTSHTGSSWIDILNLHFLLQINLIWCLHILAPFYRYSIHAVTCVEGCRGSLF